MEKYRKRPIIIEAVQYLGPESVHVDDIPSHPLPEGVEWHFYGGQDFMYYPIIRTFEGDMNVHTGNWIIKGTQGEFYPCKSSIFEEIYEKVS